MSFSTILLAGGFILQGTIVGVKLDQTKTRDNCPSLIIQTENVGRQTIKLACELKMMQEEGAPLGKRVRLMIVDDKKTAKR